MNWYNQYNQYKTANFGLNKKLIFKLKDGTKIYEVNGNYARDVYTDEYVLGGHHYKSGYEFIPEDEVWMDDCYKDKDDRDADILHEIKERHLMKNKKMEYDPAHDEAAKAEKRLRDKYKKMRENS